jgi:hypothetical protein
MARSITVRTFSFTRETEVIFYQKSNETYDYGRGNWSRLGIPDPATVYKAQQDDYNAKYIAASANDRKKTAPKERQAARKVLTDALNDYGNQHLFFNHNLTDTDRTMFNFTEAKTPSTIVPPDYPPVLVVKLGPGRQVTIYYYALPGGIALAKPDGVVACVVRWVKGPTRPAHISELVNEAVGTSKEIVLHFDEADRGETIWISATWQIQRDHLESPPSEILMVTIG